MKTKPDNQAYLASIILGDYRHNISSYKINNRKKRKSRPPFQPEKRFIFRRLQWL